MPSEGPIPGDVKRASEPGPWFVLSGLGLVALLIAGVVWKTNHSNKLQEEQDRRAAERNESLRILAGFDAQRRDAHVRLVKAELSLELFEKEYVEAAESRESSRRLSRIIVPSIEQFDLDSDPYLQDLRRKIERKEAEIAALRVRISDLQRRSADLMGSMATSPRDGDH